MRAQGIARIEARGTRHGSRAARVICAALLLTVSSAPAQDVKDGGPYVPTPQKVVDAMLDLAGVRASDFVIDLGSGDGRIVLTAATRHQARGMGVDIDQELVDRANGSAQRLAIADRVRFIRQDVHAADLSQATVLTLYLLPGMMTSLRPKILKELRPGARIVSHDFDFGDWKPDRTVEVETPEKYDLIGTWTSMLHLWIVPAPVQGVWSGDLPGANGARFQLEINQAYQRFEGRVTRNGREFALRDGQIDGSRIRFSVPRASGKGTEQFTAIVNGEQMAGEARGEEAGAVKWTATLVERRDK
ncbi:MAG TPA: methyltransferase domain-containing protein [Burkholderiales bacterium]|nr:methyltransferase domain-containing protein [Burkholderiales bacterium]